MDGHNSHYTLEFLEYAKKRNIVVLCYPAHTTHVLQGLDVAVFGAFKVYWTQATQTVERETGLKVTKDTFLKPLWEAWIKAFTPHNIRKAFARTGVWPLNRGAILEDQIAPSKETSIHAHLPITTCSPINRLTAGFATRKVLSSPSASRPDPVHVWYTPTKTRTIPIDPILLAEAEMRDSLASEPSLLFLTDSEPITSSPSLPPLAPLPTINCCSDMGRLLDLTPDTSQAAELQNALQEVNDKLEIATNALTVDRTRLVLAGMHAGRLKTSLYKKRGKASEKRQRKALGRRLA